ncbi:Lrp/AsnC family transcriptional regulator [Kutzneria buriramensis]|uniref:DNA-binding Lrp family transcriptional regulator n=1 Tax=Kutzneria buriramensis TaxID=1045776 RepID=A0A3E0HP47_9PSEU|nr:Lrp/AsnC family transcriptional regulator [Kutzneria buriramensis]REH48181.1 DNA-binding Lrp family transcriptional regulator [Kutzneria buriramensis]
MDSLDRQLVHALSVDGRAPFSRIAQALDRSDRTIATRYHHLRAQGMRVVGVVNAKKVGHVDWLVRIRCAPDAAKAIAQALSRRDDTSWVAILSGGTEITCITRVRTGDDHLLLERLARTPRINGVTAYCMLRDLAGVGGWPGRVSSLTSNQIAAVTPEATESNPVGELTDADWALFTALAVDGRTTYPRLAAVTGWSESTVRRRLADVRTEGVLFFDVDLDPARFGYGCQAVVWLTVAPAGLNTVAQTLASHVEVAFAAATTGASNIVAFVVVTDLDALYDYLAARVGSLPGVLQVETSLLGRQVKSAGRTM